jgi:hypothetical protein
VLVGLAGEHHGSLLWLGVKEDEVRKVLRRFSTARGAGRWTAACCGAISVIGSKVEVVSWVHDMMGLLRLERIRTMTQRWW